jgi:hypothetical protein
LTEVVGESRRNFERIIDHFPGHMRYRVPEAAALDGVVPERVGRIILSGGEVLVPQIREAILYPALERLAAKYRDVGGVKLIVQTTGDLVTPPIVDELLQRGVWMISVSGMDDFHEGMTEARRKQLTEKLVAMFRKARFSAFSAPLPRAGSARFGRAAGRGRTTFPQRLWPTISAMRGREDSTF